MSHSNLVNKFMNTDNIDYSKDWNNLMLVVDHIEGLGKRPYLDDRILYYGMYKGFWYAGFKQHFPDGDDTYYGVESEQNSSKFEAVYNACINFITWHNEVTN